MTIPKNTEASELPKLPFGADNLQRLMRNLDDTNYNEGSEALACRLSDCRTVIKELIAAIEMQASHSAAADAVPVGLPDMSHDTLSEEDMRRLVRSQKQARCKHDYRHSSNFGGDICAKCGKVMPSPTTAPASEDQLRKVRDLTLDYASLHFSSHGYVFNYLKGLKDAPFDASVITGAAPASESIDSPAFREKIEKFIRARPLSEGNRWYELMQFFNAHTAAQVAASKPAAGCDLCGCIGIHACPGAPIPEWTPEKIAELDAVLAKYEPEGKPAAASGDAVPDCENCTYAQSTNDDREMFCHLHVKNVTEPCAEYEAVFTTPQHQVQAGGDALSDEQAYASSGYRHFMDFDKFKQFRTDCAVATPSPDSAAKPVDGEPEAFEAWATAECYDMTKHPLHWLFLNERTYAARQGWKAGRDYALALASQPVPTKREGVELTVWEGAMPETNGKSNFTAVLVRKGVEGLDIFTDGISFAHGEYPDRVRYEADCMRHLIGELAEKPEMWDKGYDFDKHSGYVAPPAPASEPGLTSEQIECMVDAEYPVPNNPHASVLTSNEMKRNAFRKGIIAAQKGGAR